METKNVIGGIKDHQLRRVFKGKTEFIIDHSTRETLQASKRERHFHQRMLRAYLKGNEFFNFGFTRNHLNQLIPIEHKVLQSWK